MVALAMPFFHAYKPRIAGLLLRTCLPLTLFLSIWWPEFSHFRVDHEPPPPAVIERLAQQPEDSVLAEIADMSLSISLGIPKERYPEVADGILSGKLATPRFAKATFPLIGLPADLLPDGPTLQLIMASLGVEELLLEAFEQTGAEPYYFRATERILTFAQWEAQQSEPVAFLWNDHAVAARIPVLVRFWRHFRNDVRATPQQRATLLALIVRSGELLAKKSHFTARTNHGVMQNLALLQIATAFPDLDQASLWRRIAQERLELQLGFYVSDEGVVLEHSAEYHVFGARLLEMFLRLSRQGGEAPPPGLQAAVANAARFSELLLRPDGSLPLIGNTASTRGEPLPDRALTPENKLFPLSGYSMWWSTGPRPSQVVIAWAKHDRHGHKHADEPSLHFWSQGEDWLTATGYWPYGERGFIEANGWAGANAPHAIGESAAAPRMPHLLGNGESNGLRLIDIENPRMDGLLIRRQVLQLNPERLVVLDTASGSNRQLETLWTIDPRLNLKNVASGGYVSSPSATGQIFQISLASPDSPPAASILHGSWQPFAGWVVVDHNPVQASALRVEQSGNNSVVAALFNVGESELPQPLAFQIYSDPEHWRMQLGGSGGGEILERDGDRVTHTMGGANRTVRLTPPAPGLDARKAALVAALDVAIGRYPQWRELGTYQRKVYLAIGLLWLFVEALSFVLVRLGTSRRATTGLIVAGWATFALWAHLVYLR